MPPGTRQAFSADLIWWRESSSIHTVVTVWGGETDLRMLGLGDSDRQKEIILKLHDAAGNSLATWRAELRPGVPVIVDSRDHPNVVDEGVLAVHLTGNNAPAGENRRLYSMVDWYSDSGELVSLHSDHSIARSRKSIEFTEIVLLETSQSRNFLVLVNGREPQGPDSVALQVRNYCNQTRNAVYSRAMAPFSVHKLSLMELFPNLSEFCAGKHATLEGRFEARNLFTRPYVMTEDKRLAGYHGGDRYTWNGMPRFIYKALGYGEANPMVAIHSGSLTTTVNLLNSHGDLEEDFWVDARLYDQSGNRSHIARNGCWLGATALREETSRTCSVTATAHSPATSR